MHKHLNLFAQLAKIDLTRREVWGIATAETVDKEGEIFDYASSKPYFKRCRRHYGTGNVRQSYLRWIIKLCSTR